jgi:hypothetical protein
VVQIAQRAQRAPDISFRVDLVDGQLLVYMATSRVFSDFSTLRVEFEFILFMFSLSGTWQHHVFSETRQS